MQRSSVSIEDSASEDITSENSQSEQSYCAPSEEYQEPNFGLIDQLITRRGTTSTDTILPEAIKRDIGHAPLVSASVIVKYGKDLVPQYGFLGSKGTEGEVIKLFHNTNVPFSTFICGVQGSGKSHTTACMLENALIPSQQLGRLQAPVAALVFSYSEFSSGGSGFTLSEAAFLGSANQDTASQKVKKITVLVSPSNPAIKKFYRAIPGIKVLEFKLRAKSLDIATLLTLMGMNEKADVPLYMAKVESILRAIATENEDGVFDYSLFKQKIAMENFDPKQTNMLDMRLGLLESFLDKDENTPEPTFRPGEITIMDLSDPFITPNTACILFKLGLERFTQSRALGKMVVLDEAHKYMLNTPGSKMLTGHLATLIRLQRHKGVRVIISTQEPTLSTDLIALCSVTVIHRFTSPAWYSALKKHINAMENDEEILRQIESLETGEALVYAPNAVMGKEEDGTLIKLPGQLLKLNIRKRITKDGGESIMAI
ncbi:hypothetical protein HBI38_094290 [Parastagonospora nodorum]|nr:hypothetical protein HBI10_127500 [Parastagonospora nodorum]KAH4024024.1 hypothetical protein HBI13_082040 [Parastagonospora nodorum]KAH4104277.1 hypothetical protein HBH46_101710 [Parastagonospora nodorum]KAH4222940.1 hypothetical protein HBI06_141230 [Parastagonospora nodorum]KAH4240378.1 hypothetical protein HBI05_107510 [Parastagonospora nodorum]